MNYLQMYTNLSIAFALCCLIAFLIVAAAMDGNSKRAKIGAFAVLILFTLLAIFCAAMAGLLS